MLEPIKQWIQNLPDVPFGTLFDEYILQVQDKAIQREIQQAANRAYGLDKIEKLLHSDFKEVRSHDKRKNPSK